MSDAAGLPTTPLFPPGYRASCLLLHVTSLPSAHGIGDVGPAACSWIDRLLNAGQRWWQALPLGPTGYGNSPYQSLSAFAGNFLLVSPDLLVREGLLRQSDLEPPTPQTTRVNFAAVAQSKLRLLETAWKNFQAASANMRAAYDRFCLEQAHWLDDYALFRSLKHHHAGVHYLEWPQELVTRQPQALKSAAETLALPVSLVRFAQFLIFQQGALLRDHARARGVRLIGDLPFFVSPDSSDMWAHPELFLLDRQRRPVVVAGVPPDAFSADGQRWGNPIYDWEAHRRTGYRWWIDRARALLAHVDAIRLDHFRGFAAAWHIPANSPTARTGEWVPGPGADLLGTALREVGNAPFIAEDLGIITPDVTALLERFQLAGTRVLQFAFDGNPRNPHLPHSYAQNVVAYTATHDNNTSRAWFAELSAPQRWLVSRAFGLPVLREDQAAHALIEAAWASPAALAIAPLQDLLNLGAEARMNTPGTPQGNWAWRCTDEMLATAPFQMLADLTRRTSRVGAPIPTNNPPRPPVELAR
jgi:4-alpha-glucanotransferase